MLDIGPLTTYVILPYFTLLLVFHELLLSMSFVGYSIVSSVDHMFPMALIKSIEVIWIKGLDNLFHKTTLFSIFFSFLWYFYFKSLKTAYWIVWKIGF